MQQQIVPKRDTEVTSVTSPSGTEFIIADSYGEPLWLYGQEFGPMFVVQARSFEDALEAVHDELPTVPEDELHEAYGFDTAEALDRATERADAGEGECPELAEGHYYQSNSSGTGVVFPGYYEWLDELTPEHLRDHRISIEIRRID